MKDFLGDEIEVGDTLVVQHIGYKDLELRKVVKITEKMVGIDRGHNHPDQILRYVDPKRTVIAYKGA